MVMYSEEKGCQLGAHLSLILSTMIAISKDDCFSLIETNFLKNPRIITRFKSLSVRCRSIFVLQWPKCNLSFTECMTYLVTNYDNSLDFAS